MAKFSTLELSEKIQEALPENKKLQIILEGDAATFSGLATQYEGIRAEQLADLVVEIGEKVFDPSAQPELPVDLILLTAKADEEDVAVMVRNPSNEDEWFGNSTKYDWSEVLDDYDPEYYNFELIVKP